MAIANYFRVLVTVAVTTLAAGLLALVVGVVPAQAAFPGNNGKIVFSNGSGSSDIHVMNPDGTGETKLTNDGLATTIPPSRRTGPRLYTKPTSIHSAMATMKLWR